MFSCFTKYIYAILKLKGSIQGKDISIDICSNNKKKIINVDMDNQLLIPK
jgi:hypothetical protein